MPDPATTQMISSQGGTTSPPEPNQFQAYHVPDEQPQGSGVMRFLHGMAMAHLGLAGEEYRQQQEQKRNEAQILSSIALQHPEVAQSEDFMKTLAKSTSPNFANAIGMFAQSSAAQRAVAQKGMPQMEQGGGTQQASFGPHPDSGDLSDPNTWRQHKQAVHDFAVQNPNNDFVQQRAQQEIEYADKQIADLQKQQDFELTKGQQKTEFEETKALKEQTAAQTEQLRATTQAIAQQANQERAQHDQEMEAITKQTQADKREQMITQFTKNLDTSRDKILGDFAKTPSTAFKARVEGYNSSAQQFYSKHATAGAPTLLKYSEEPGKVYGTNPKIDAVPPSYGSYKGKSGWLDADGNFYPDAGTD